LADGGEYSADVLVVGFGPQETESQQHLQIDVSVRCGFAFRIFVFEDAQRLQADVMRDET